MNRDGRTRAVDTDLDARLRAAAQALREGSRTQVDAALGLREILHTTSALADPPDEPAGGATAAPWSPPSGLLRRPQRLALAVNLLLVVVLGVLVVRVAGEQRDALSGQPVTPATASTMVAATSRPAVTKTVVEVPKACLDAAELADEVISHLDRNQRDQRLFAALRDYTIASQKCRRAAEP
jgi:hypothetical protein